MPLKGSFAWLAPSSACRGSPLVRLFHLPLPSKIFMVLPQAPTFFVYFCLSTVCGTTVDKLHTLSRWLVGSAGHPLCDSIVTCRISSGELRLNLVRVQRQLLYR